MKLYCILALVGVGLSFKLPNLDDINPFDDDAISLPDDDAISLPDDVTVDDALNLKTDDITLDDALNRIDDLSADDLINIVGDLNVTMPSDCNCSNTLTLVVCL